MSALGTIRLVVATALIVALGCAVVVRPGIDQVVVLGGLAVCLRVVGAFMSTRTVTPKVSRTESRLGVLVWCGAGVAMLPTFLVALSNGRWGWVVVGLITYMWIRIETRGHATRTRVAGWRPARWLCIGGALVVAAVSLAVVDWAATGAGSSSARGQSVVGADLGEITHELTFTPLVASEKSGAELMTASTITTPSPSRSANLVYRFRDGETADIEESTLGDGYFNPQQLGPVERRMVVRIGAIDIYRGGRIVGRSANHVYFEINAPDARRALSLAVSLTSYR